MPPIVIVSFTVSANDKPILKRCVDRALQLFSVSRQDVEMDLSATHANGCPLDFAKLLEASTDDFVHDLVGIRRHINRRTGQLEDHFHPRCALPVPTKNEG